METYLLTVDVPVDGGLKQNIFALKVPTSQPLPSVGDFVQIPAEAAEREGLPVVLEIISRRFILDEMILNQLSPDCNSCITLLAQVPS